MQLDVLLESQHVKNSASAVNDKFVKALWIHPGLLLKVGQYFFAMAPIQLPGVNGRGIGFSIR
jgi:hypothetical protein